MALKPDGHVLGPRPGFSIKRKTRRKVPVRPSWPDGDFLRNFVTYGSLWSLIGESGVRGMRDFDQVYTEYYSTVYGYVLRLCRDAGLAEEVTQETFFKALKSIDAFQGTCRLDVWLCQIAKNTCFSLMKKRKRQERLPPEEEWGTAEDMEKKLEDRDAAFRVHEILHRLPEPYREVFWLRVFGELDFARIAALFQKTESWARVTYHRARLKIKEELP